MKGPVLVVFPHPDDEAFGVSGSLLKWTKQGVQVTYICLTLGEMGRNMGKPTFATRESLPHIRRKELEEAASKAGIQDLRRFGLRDKTVEFENEEVLAKRILDVIHEIKPELVITFYPEFSVHPDHDATGRATIRAVEMISEGERPVVHCLAFSHDCVEKLGQPDVLRDVSDVFDEKLGVLKAHQSQTQGMVAGMQEQLEKRDPALMERFTTERFWTYRW